LRTLQPLSLYAADSIFVGGYLTTPGQPAPEAWKMIEDLGFTIEVDYQFTPSQDYLEPQPLPLLNIVRS
jgi:biotin synthase-like enzyme